MNKPFIVALAGQAGAGKDTAASLLAEALHARGKRVARMGFADPIRSMLQALGVPPQYMTERTLKEAEIPGFGASYRHMAQTLGTEWGRQCMSSQFWTNHMAQRVEAARQERRPDFVLITDARFPNEGDWVRAQGGCIVRVLRPRLDPVRAHESEAHALQHDHELHNDADLINLRSRCAALSVQLLAERALEA